MRPQSSRIELLPALVVYLMIWGSLLYLAFELVPGQELGLTSYLYFSAAAVVLNLLAAIFIGRPLSSTLFFSFFMITIFLLSEEVLINGFFPEAGFATVLAATLVLPFLGSIPKLTSEVRYALQVSGLVFASRLVFIPFPQEFMKASAAPPSIYALIIILALAFLAVKRISLKQVGLTIGNYSLPRQISAGVSIGLFSGMVEYLILKPAPIQLTGDGLQAILYIIIVMTLFVGFGEELLFRGLLQEAYQNLFPTWSAVLMASLQFGIMHYGWFNPLEVLFSCGIATVFGYFFWKTRSLIIPITAHSLGNIIMFIIAAYPDTLFTSSAIGLTAILALVLIMPALPWQQLRTLEIHVPMPKLIHRSTTQGIMSLTKPADFNLQRKTAIQVRRAYLRDLSDCQKSGGTGARGVEPDLKPRNSPFCSGPPAEHVVPTF